MSDYIVSEKFEGKIYNVGGGIENSASLLEMTSICEKITGNKTSNSYISGPYKTENLV